jgi:hypothetical protein
MVVLLGAALLSPLMCCYLQQVTDLLQLAPIITVYKRLGYNKLHDFTGYMVGPPCAGKFKKFKFKSPQKCLPPLLHFPFQWWGVCNAQCSLRLYIYIYIYIYLFKLSVLLLLLPLLFIFETQKTIDFDGS